MGFQLNINARVGSVGILNNVIKIPGITIITKWISGYWTLVHMLTGSPALAFCRNALEYTLKAV